MNNILKLNCHINNWSISSVWDLSSFLASNIFCPSEFTLRSETKRVTVPMQEIIMTKIVRRQEKVVYSRRGRLGHIAECDRCHEGIRFSLQGLQEGKAMSSQVLAITM